MTAATGRHPPRAYGGAQHRIAKPVGRRGGVVLMPGHAAREQGRTLFPSTVVHASLSPRVLIDGVNQRKIGRKVTKGRWTGMRIFTLTLEERATCPRACQQWDSCYGNNMPYARRHIGGAEFEAKLDAEASKADGAKADEAKKKDNTKRQQTMKWWKRHKEMKKMKKL